MLLTSIDNCREVMIRQFFVFYEYYVEVCTENMNKDGQQMIVRTKLNKKSK